MSQNANQATKTALRSKFAAENKSNAIFYSYINKKKHFRSGIEKLKDRAVSLVTKLPKHDEHVEQLL